MARAEGERDEARRSAGEAYQRLLAHEVLLFQMTESYAVDRERLRRVEQLAAEFEADLQAKGDDWHPRFRRAVELVVEQLGQAIIASPPVGPDESGTIRNAPDDLGTIRNTSEQQGGDDAAQAAGTG
jgi:hypothetical protein